MADSRRIHILHVGPQPGGRGGLGTSILRLLKSPLAERYRLDAVTTWRDDAGGVRRFTIFVTGLCRLALWCLKPGLRIVHVHAAIGGSWYRKSLCILLARLLRRAVVLQVRVGTGDIASFDRRIDAARRAFFRFSFSAATKVVTVSRVGAAELERRYGLRSVALIPNPPPEAPPSSALRLPARGGRVLYLGGFRDPAKGGETMLAALPDLLATPGVDRIVLAGPGQAPRAAEAWLPTSAILHLPGWLDEAAKAEMLSSSDIFVLPSNSEGMPNALLEAMAHGLAIVATPVGSVPDLLTHEIDALIAPPEDSSALAGAIKALVDDPALQERLGEAAHARYRSMSADETWNGLDAVYQELAANAR